MAKQSTAALKMLQEKAIKEVESAQTDLATALKKLDAEKEKDTLLVDYKQGYVNSLNQSLNDGLNLESYQNYQNFLVKLDEAIDAQAGVVAMANAEVSVKRTALQATQKKKLSYDVLIDRAEKRVQKAALKSDQKMMDEFAMRASRTKVY